MFGNIFVIHFWCQLFGIIHRILMFLPVLNSEQFIKNIINKAEFENTKVF